MNKNILYYAFIAVLFTFVACNDDEDVDVSSVTETNFDFASVDADITMEEADQTITVNFTLDDRQIVPTAVAVTLDGEGTTATNGEDFTFAPTNVSVAAYIGKGSFSFDVHDDVLAEESETIRFKLSGVHDPFGAQSERFFTVTLENHESSELVLTFDFDGFVDFAGTTYDLCGAVGLDMDFYVMDVNGNDLGIYQAATGACPEVMTIDGWDDGDYYIMSNLWGNGLDSSELGGFVYDPPFEYLVNISIDKPGIYNEKFVPVDNWNSNDLDAQHHGLYNFKEALVVNVSGTTYTVSAPDGTVVVQGFNSPKGITE